MKYYAVQVRSSKEPQFIEHAKKQLLGEENFNRFIFLQRRLTVFRSGKKIRELQRIFPGYVFIETETDLTPEIFAVIRKTPHFYRFLKNNKDVRELQDHDLDIVKHFMSFGETAEESTVYFNDQDRIVVTKGPLKGLEGNIIKVDKRKKRAKIRIDFDNSPLVLDLSFELMEKEKNVDTK